MKWHGRVRQAEVVLRQLGHNVGQKVSGTSNFSRRPLGVNPEAHGYTAMASDFFVEIVVTFQTFQALRHRRPSLADLERAKLFI